MVKQKQKRPSSCTQFSLLRCPVLLLPVASAISGQLSLLDSSSPFQFHQLFSLFAFPGDEAPAEASKGQEKDQNQR